MQEKECTLARMNGGGILGDEPDHARDATRPGDGVDYEPTSAPLSTSSK